MNTTRPIALALVAAVGLALPLAALPLPQVEAAAVTRPAPTSPAPAAQRVTDQPLESFRGELLDLALQAVTKMPKLHIKERSRWQENVVALCLELEQPERAYRYMQRIDNWRRGACYADLAHYCVTRGDLAGVERYLDLADGFAERAMAGDEGQAWRSERVRAKISRAYLALGDSENARKFGLALSDAEMGTIISEDARALAADEFGPYLAEFDKRIPDANFDQLQAMLQGCLELYDRFYENPERRAAVGRTVELIYAQKMPASVQIGMEAELVDVALAHDDRAQAEEVLERVTKLVDDPAGLSVADHVLLMAPLAVLRHRVGQEERARQEIEAAVKRYIDGRDQIQMVFRAGVLLPVAEAYADIGDLQGARRNYAWVVEEAAENPNSRPLAKDLSTTCVSMARHGVDPGPELWQRLRELEAGLGDPW